MKTSSGSRRRAAAVWWERGPSPEYVATGEMRRNRPLAAGPDNWRDRPPKQPIGGQL